MTKRTAEREQFLADVLTTAVEGGINHWSAISEYKHEYCRVPVTVAQTFAIVHVYEPDEGETDANGYAEEGMRLDIDAVARGIGVLREAAKNGEGFSRGYWKEFWLADRTNGEDGDYDAGIADCVVQAALLGEVVYG